MTRTLTAVAAGFVVAVFASVSSAQIFYLPVQHQYGQEDTYYYGGSDPSIFRQAQRETALRARNMIENEPVRVYSDLLPFRNARVNGFTRDDARNDAYANAQRYYRKGDLEIAAVGADGARYVLPSEHRRYDNSPVAAHRPYAAPRSKNSENKGVIIIIPKKPAKQDGLSKPAMLVSTK